MIDDEGNNQVQQSNTNSNANGHPVSLDDQESNACDGTLHDDRKRKRPSSVAAASEIEEEAAAAEIQIHKFPKDDGGDIRQQNTDLEDEENVSPHINESSQDILGKLGVPQGMIIPATKRQYDIIQMAGTRCRTTAQFEIYLKVKQAHNPDFSFLDSKDELHPFYQWIKNGNNNGKAHINDNKNESSNGVRSSTGGLIKVQACDSTVCVEGNNSAEAMGMLAMYGSSSSDDDCDDDDDERSAATAAAAVRNSKPIARECGTKIKICNGSNHVEKVEKIGTAANDKATQKSGDEADAIEIDDSKQMSSHSSESIRNTSSSTSLTLKQRKAERLKRAKLLRHHFANK